MQKVSITEWNQMNIHCPFCGAVSLTPEGLFQCDHTLFQASDEGFEFISPRLNLKTEDIELGDRSIDEFTDEIEYPEAVKFAIYQPAPSFFGGYVGFAPM